MKIGFLVIGNEILSGARKDINAEFLINALKTKNLGIDFLIFTRDFEPDIITAFNWLSEVTKYLFISGGLGLTPDDITLQSIAKATGRKLVKSSIKRNLALESIERVNAKKYLEYIDELSLSLEGAEPIPNIVGIAQGEKFEFNKCTVFVLPGVPKEFQEMFIGYVLNMLEEGEKKLKQEYYIDSKEPFIISILREIEGSFNVSTFSYPPVLDEKFLKIIIESNSDESLYEACNFFEKHLEKEKILYEKRKP